MLNQQDLEKLHALHLNGMADAYSRQIKDTSAASLSFEGRFGLLVDHHWSWRENQAMARRLKNSKLDAEPCVEDVDYRHPRGLDRQLMRSLVGSQWVVQHLSVLLTGPTGIGKSWLAQKACRDGYTVLYRPASKLFRDLAMARADGSLGRLLATIARTDVLVVDDFVMAPLSATVSGRIRSSCPQRRIIARRIMCGQCEAPFWSRHACVWRSHRRTNKVAADLYRRGIPMENLRRAVWLGSARKYMAMLNGQPPAPIASLGYFIALLDEVVRAPVTDAYWEHVRHKLEALERRWRQASSSAVSAEG